MSGVLFFRAFQRAPGVPARAVVQRDWKAELWERHDPNKRPTGSQGMVLKVFFKGEAFDDKCEDWCHFCLGKRANSPVCRRHQVTFYPEELRNIIYDREQYDNRLGNRSRPSPKIYSSTSTT